MKRFLFAFLIAAGLLVLLAAPALAAAHSFYVHPSGKDDTTAIQAAFSAAITAGPGSVVQLSAGHFYTNNIVVTGFDGTFKGAGEHKTIIDCLRGLNPGGPGVQVVSSDVPLPFLFAFLGGDVCVSRLSFDITASYPAETWNGSYDYLNGVVYLSGDTKAAFDRVAFTAQSGDFYDLNTDWGILASGDAAHTGGHFSVTCCRFATLEGFGEDSLTGVRIAIGGSVFTSPGMSCGFFDTSSSKITVAGNRFQNGNKFGNPTLYSVGVVIEQDPGYGLTASRYLVSHNSFKVAPPADAVDLWDFAFSAGEGQLIRAVVADNTVRLKGSLTIPFVNNAAGIGGAWTQRVLALRNRFSGIGEAIYLGTPVTNAGDNAPGSISGWKIIANDVRGVIPLPPSVGGAGAPIWLGTGTTRCLVVGGPPPTTVLDEGVGNILINVHKLPLRSAAHTAAPIIGSLRQMKSLRGMMRP